MRRRYFGLDLIDELDKARKKHPTPIHSRHEGFAVLMEEVDEVKEAVWHTISFHAHHPDAPGPKDEYELAHLEIQKWAKAFPKASVCIGNHDARVIRLAETVNIPAKLLRDYREVWDTPHWSWADDHL